MGDKIFEEIILKVSADTSGLDANLDDAESSMDSFTESTDSSNTSLVAWTAAAAAAAAGVAFLVKGQADAVQEADAYAKRLNIATQELLALQTAAGKFNIEAEDVNEGLKNMVERLGEASLEGRGATFDAIAKLGLNLKELEDLSTAEKFIEISDALSKLDSESERTFLSMEIGQEEFFKLAEFADLGREGMTDLIKEAERLNGNLSDIDIQNIRDMEASAGAAQAAFNSIFREIAASLAPAMSEMFSIASDLFVLFRQEGLPIIGEWSTKISDIFLNFVDNVLPSILTAGSAAFNGLSLLMTSLVDVAGQVFGAIGEGWGLLSEEITGDSNWIEQITGIIAVAAQAWPELIAKPFLLIGETISNFLAGLEDKFFAAFDSIRKEGLILANSLGQLTDAELEAGIIGIDQGSIDRESQAKSGFTQFFKELAAGQRFLIDENEKVIQGVIDKTAREQEKFSSTVGERVQSLRDAISGTGNFLGERRNGASGTNGASAGKGDINKLISASEVGSKASIDLLNSRQVKQGRDINEQILGQSKKQTKVLEKIEKKPSGNLPAAKGI